MNPKKEKAFLIFRLFLGLCFQCVGIGIFSKSDFSRILSLVCIWIGSVLFSLSANKLYRISYEKNFPEAAYQEKIELEDERNIQIRNRAKSQTSDIIRWVMMGLAMLNYMINGSLLITFTLIGVFVLIHILDWYYTDKYQREM